MTTSVTARSIALVTGVGFASGLVDPISAQTEQAAVNRDAEARPAALDAGTLVTKEEVAAVQGCAMTDSKVSGGLSGDLRVSQCFYSSAEPNKSVSLALAQSDPGSPTKRTLKDFWHETFDRYSGDADEEKANAVRQGDRETDGSKEGGHSHPEQVEKNGKNGEKVPVDHKRNDGEEEMKHPPERIDGLGDSAYWMNNPVGGVLYVLKGDRFVRISIGGPDKQAVKLEKSKALAAVALKRL